MKSIYFLIFLFTTVFAGTPEWPLSRARTVPVQPKKKKNLQEEKQAAENQRQFCCALSRFDLWYAGPKVIGSPIMVPQGSINVQPYVFLQQTYAEFNQERQAIDQPDLWTLNVQAFLQAGITSWLDFSVLPQTVTNFRGSKSSGFFGDTFASLGFLLLEQGPWLPALKLCVNETFPTGRYQNGNPEKMGVDFTGGGSFVSGFSLKLGKVLFWWTDYPVNTRFLLTYNIPVSVEVDGFNAYGGGYATLGKVRPGNNVQADFGVEWSFAKHWVFVTDVLYEAFARSKFNGIPGFLAFDVPATVGLPSGDQLSLAPVLEYNPTPRLGVLGGVWFSVYGRNSADFISSYVSVTYRFNAY